VNHQFDRVSSTEATLLHMYRLRRPFVARTIRKSA
jgi:hypothetical protein